LSGAIGCLGLLPVFYLSIQRWGALDPRGIAVASLAAALLAWMAARFFRRRIGGYTGDCLGAVQQLAEIAFLLGGLAASSRVALEST
jgi:adenosylcobinamide-GDP ribazoletransferase